MKRKIIKTIIILILLITSIVLYAFFIGTKGLEVKEYNVASDILPTTFHGLKIVHLSDIHYGRTVLEKELTNIVEKVNLIKPDIVILSGDLIDKDTDLTPKMSDQISNILNKLSTKIGKFAVSGNHDYQFDNWKSIIKNGGFINIDDRYELLFNESLEPIILAGISTSINGTLSVKDKTKDLFTYINSLKENQTAKEPFKILVLHEPDFIDELDKEAFDLILSGHSHNGQVRLPFIGAVITPPYAKKYYDEHYQFGKTTLYISSGIGTSNINVRLFNRPSINLYRLTTK